MTQISLTDDRILDAEVTDTEPDAEPVTEPSLDDAITNTQAPSDTYPKLTRPPIDYGSVSGYPAVAEVDIESMELETDVPGWRSFPHPATIYSHIEDDMDADQAVMPEEVRDAIDALTDEPELGEFLVFDAADAYEYLETLQWKSDLHLENFHRQQLIINQLSNGRGYSKGSNLSTYDKKWICQWEVQRRLANRDFDTWGDESKLTKENRGLPNAE